MTHLSFIYPGWHFSFRGVGMNSIWLVTQSFLRALSPKAWRLENISCVYDKAPNHYLLVTFMSDTTFLNCFLFSIPFFKREHRTLLIDLSRERDSPSCWKQILQEKNKNKRTHPFSSFLFSLSVCLTV